MLAMRATPLLSLLLVLVACEPPPLSELGAGGVAAPPIEITWPKQESEMNGCEVFVFALNVDNFTLTDFHDRSPAEGEGHVHVIWELAGDSNYTSSVQPWCDVNLVPYSNAENPRFATAGSLLVRAGLYDSAHDPILGDDGLPIESAEMFLNYEPAETCFFVDGGIEYP